VERSSLITGSELEFECCCPLLYERAVEAVAREYGIEEKGYDGCGRGKEKRSFVSVKAFEF